MSLHIKPICAFEDNYIWTIHDEQRAILVDPGDAKPALDYLHKNNLNLIGVLITHHHYDHINGVTELLKHYPNCEIFAPIDPRIGFKTSTVKEGDLAIIEALELQFQVIETPGHTSSHVCYYNDKWLFCGDTLFNMGCGRMFEGTAKQFVNSLNKLKALDDDLLVYCTHEYTLTNLAFALSLEPENSLLIQYRDKITKMRQQHKPSIPVPLKLQKSLNPFLRTDRLEMYNFINNKTNSKIDNEIDCFAKMRQMKDIF
ncbi:MAG: hydroxyacylglutathione hydrolase [Xanthomonadales bacterium]|nr:hydroxyacylglutathione hydrolase [Xanthomonadales bacterium]